MKYSTFRDQDRPFDDKTVDAIQMIEDTSARCRKEIKMKKRFKGIATLLLAGVLTMGMSASVFGAAAARDAAVTSADTTLTIKKEIAFFNPDVTTINYPAVEFTYTVAPVTVASGTTVTDATDKVANVKDGVTGGVSMGTDNKATFAAGNIAASSTGALITANTFEVTVHTSAFTAPGVYRYEVTEKAPDDYAALGYEAATTHVNKRYLDVYIENDESSGGFKVKGYTLFLADNANKSITTSDAGDKTEGFVHEVSGENYLNDTDVDKYKTFNVEITKTITGTLADKTHEFPFSAAVTAGASASNVKLPVSIEKSGSTTSGEIQLSSGAATSAEVAKLANGDKVTIVGIPVSSTVNISEKNDTSDSYTVTTKGLTDGPSGALAANTESTAGTVTTSNVEKKEVTFTNNLDAPSPTGVVLRFAPYLFLLAGAMLLLMMSSRRRAY